MSAEWIPRPRGLDKLIGAQAYGRGTKLSCLHQKAKTFAHRLAAVTCPKTGRWSWTIRAHRRECSRETACLELLRLEKRYERLYDSLDTGGTTVDLHSWRTSGPTMHNYIAKQDAIEAIEQLPRD